MGKQESAILYCMIYFSKQTGSNKLSNNNKVKNKNKVQ